jgi:hypothetical protein
MKVNIELIYVLFVYFSYIVAVSFIGGGNQRTWRKHRPVASHWQTYHIMLYTSPWSRFELTTSVVIGTDWIGSCKSNYYTITTTTAPSWYMSFCELYYIRIYHVLKPDFYKQSLQSLMVFITSNYHDKQGLVLIFSNIKFLSIYLTCQRILNFQFHLLY